VGQVAFRVGHLVEKPLRRALIGTVHPLIVTL
jgi:hypothetical protein